MSEVYISIDVEADGPIPGDNSMLSFGAAAFVLDPDEARGFRYMSGFEANLDLLPGATPNPDTMAWWAGQPEAWAACRKDTRPAADVMADFRRWLENLRRPNALVLAGYPVTYDFMFVYWYYVHFNGFPAPFGFQGLDIKTLAMERLGGPYKHATKRNMPKEWFAGAPPHTHKALDDAIGQGFLLMNLRTRRGA